MKRISILLITAALLAITSASFAATKHCNGDCAVNSTTSASTLTTDEAIMLYGTP